MKKIITLVLALVMVFALAAPAMALTNDPYVTVGTSNGAYTMTGQLLGSAPAFGPYTYLPGVAANQAWTINMPVYYAFNINVAAITPTWSATNPAHTELAFRVTGAGVDVEWADSFTPTVNSFYRAASGYGTTTAYIAIPFGTAANEALDGAPVAGSAAPNALQYPMYATTSNGFWLSNNGTNMGKFMYAGVGYVDGTSSAPTITAQIGLFDMTAATTYPLSNINGQAASVTRTTVIPGGIALNAPATTVVYNVVVGSNTITIAVNGSTGAVTGVYYNGTAAADAAGAAATRILSSNAGVGGYLNNYDFSIGGIAASATEKANIVAAMNYFGFDFALVATGAVFTRHFVAKIPTGAATASINVPLNTATITVPTNDTVQPPKTGDAASIAGFIMIAAAILAAAGLAYRKVRA